jgi:hypothetical protein
MLPHALTSADIHMYTLHSPPSSICILMGRPQPPPPPLSAVKRQCLVNYSLHILTFFGPGKVVFFLKVIPIAL